MKMNYWLALTGVSVLSLFVGCSVNVAPGSATGSGASSQTPSSIGPGTLAGNTYRHDFFGMTATLPASWSTVHRNDAGESTTGASEKGLSWLVEGEAADGLMFLASELPLGEEQSSFAAIFCSTSNVAAWPPPHTKEEFLTQGRTHMMASTPDVQCSGEIETVEIGGRSFALLRYEIGPPPRTVSSRHYAMVHGGQTLLFIMYCETDEAESVLDAFVASVEFD